MVSVDMISYFEKLSCRFLDLKDILAGLTSSRKMVSLLLRCAVCPFSQCVGSIISKEGMI